MSPGRGARGGMARVDDNPFGIPGFTSSTYGDSFADVYDDWYADLGDGDFVDAVVRALPPGPSAVLELGVGTGRLLARVAAARGGAGDRLVGVDTSVPMLDRARALPVLAGAEISVHDFSVSLPDGPFDAVFCGYNTLFNLPDTDATARAFVLASSVMRRGARLLIDAFVPARDAEADRVSVRSMTADSVVLSVSRHDAQGQRMTGHFVEMTHGQPLVLRPWSVRYLTPGQMDSCAAGAGLRLESRHADGNGTPHTDASARHVSVYVRD